MNNKIRVVCVEAEASDEAVQQILRTLSFGSHLLETPAAIEAPAALPAPSIEAPTPPIARVTAKPDKPQKPRASKPRPATPSAPPADGATRTAIIAALTKRPMTSGEVIKETGLSGPSIYSMLGIMRNRGEIESRKTDDSIYPKQYLAKK